MNHILAKTGKQRGTSWEISEKPLLVGRSESCDVRLVDPIVSRWHCELKFRDDQIHLRDLDSSNATFVNGQRIDSVTVKPGDEIAVGGVVFVVTDASGVPPVGDDDDETLITVSLADASYVNDNPNDPLFDTLPRSVREYRELFVLARLFSRASSVRELTRIFQDWLHAKFDPDEFWLAWYYAGAEEFIYYPTENGAQGEDAPVEAMRRSISSDSGLIAPRSVKKRRAQYMAAAMVAPLAVGGDPMGAIAIQSDAGMRTYASGDLELFVGAAHAFAPYLRALEHVEQLRRDYNYARKEAGIAERFIGEAPAVQYVRELAVKAAATDLNVLLVGETGTGKDVIARMVHDLGARAIHPYVIVSCASIPRELFDIEMFGHEKGAFPGATEQKSGWLEEAHGGTLLLDEVGDLSPESQARILGAIETGTFHRVGGSREIRVDVRIISTTNKTLDTEAGIEGFRKDLFHRLNGFEIRLPPLREHAEDIRLLVNHFLERDAKGMQGLPAIAVAPDAMRRLVKWHWPGNVRELAACVARAVAFAKEGTIQASDVLISPGFTRPPDGELGLPRLDQVEKEHITRMIRHAGGNISATARALGISRATLYSKLKLYAIENKDSPGPLSLG